VLRFENGLQMRTEGHLEFEAQRVAIRGREEVRIESGADAHIRAAGSLNLKGNGDVELQGEQVPDQLIGAVDTPDSYTADIVTGSRD